jgi:hypothetical protein
MERKLDANIHLVKINIVKNIISKVNSTLSSLGFMLGDSSTLLLYDPDMEMDFDIEPAKDIDNVTRRLSSWPLLGIVSYVYENSLIDVSFRKYKEKESIHCVSISFPEELYRNERALRKIKNLIIKLHEKLGAIRTVSDIDIESDSSGYNIDDEVNLLVDKKIEGEYWLDILNKDYFNLNIEMFMSKPGVKIKELQENILLERDKKYI